MVAVLLACTLLKFAMVHDERGNSRCGSAGTLAFAALLQSLDTGRQRLDACILHLIDADDLLDQMSGFKVIDACLAVLIAELDSVMDGATDLLTVFSRQDRGKEICN